MTLTPTNSYHPYPADPTRILFLQGSDREIGFQHGQAVRERALQGMPRFYIDFWRRMLRTRPHGVLESGAQRLAALAVDALLMQRLQSTIPLEFEQRMRGMAEALSSDYEELVAAVVLPDLLPLLQSFFVRLQPHVFIEAAFPRLGCTSFVADAGKFLHGRNLDFPGVAYWDRYPVIQLTSRPGRLRYIGFTTAGAPLAGITGINEEKISVSLHQHYCRRSTMNGTLPFFISEEILGKARDLKQAAEILKKHRVGTSWAFLVADGKTRDAFIYECHPDAGAFRHLHEEGVLTHSNYFVTKECRPQEYATTARMNWDNYWRRERLAQRLRSVQGGLTPEEAVTILSEHHDPYWEEEKILNRTVSQVYNIQSLVIDYDEMTAWLAEGEAPIHLRRYRRYDLGALFAGKDGRTSTTAPGYTFKDARKQAAKEEYILSFISAFDGKLPEALERAERSLSHDFCPEVAQVAAVVGLKLGRGDQAKEWLGRARDTIATKAKERAKKLPPEYFESSIFLARALNLDGKHEAARKIYAEVAESPDLDDAHLRQLASRARPFRKRALGRIVMPYSSYIPFA